MNKPASVEKYIEQNGPFDPALTDAERAAVQRWINSESESLILRCKIHQSPSEQRIQELETKLSESESAQMCAGETIGELLSYITDAEAAIHYLVTEHVSMRDIEHIVGVYPTIKEALRSHAERTAREKQEGGDE